MGEPLPKSSIHASAMICDGISKGESARKLITARPGRRASPVASASAAPMTIETATEPAAEDSVFQNATRKARPCNVSRRTPSHSPS